MGQDQNIIYICSCLGLGVAPSPGTEAPSEGWLLSDKASSSSSLIQQKEQLIFIVIALIYLFSVWKEPFVLT